MYYPQNIIMEKYLSYDKHWKFIFGSYVESHEYRKITNGMEELIVSDIWLGPTENFQGSNKIFSLKTGRMVTRK